MRTHTRWIAPAMVALGLGIGLCLEGDEGAAAGRVPPTILHVSTDGRDDWSGRLPDPAPRRNDGPFASLERARDEIRALRGAGRLSPSGAVVSIRGDTYYRSRTFELGPDDGGAEGAPIVYEAYRGETPSLSGGVEVRGFRPVNDAAVLRRIDPSARRRILRVNLPSSGIESFGHLSARGFGRRIDPTGLELFFDGRPMQLARWPNEGWAHIASVPAESASGRFTYSGERPRRWVGADDAWLHGYWSKEWADSYEKVRTIDPERHEIATLPPHGVYGYAAGGRYYAVNLLEELDATGEWYLDRQSGWLYFWPPRSLRSSRVVVSQLEAPLIRLSGASHVTLRGLTLEYARGAGIVIQGGGHDLVSECTVRNVGTIGVVIGGAVRSEGGAIEPADFLDDKNGSHNGVSGCEIYDTGEGAVVLSGGDRRTLSPGRNFAIDNHLRRYCRWTRTYRPAVALYGVGNRVAHNLIHDAPHAAILLHGNEHTIEFNDIHHVCSETKDAGAFYMGRDLSERGNILRYNFFHDFDGDDVQAIYLDDFASGTTVMGNICFRTGRGVLIGGGRDNVVENNVFVECHPAVWVDGRGLTYAKGLFDGREATLLDRANTMSYTRPPYSERYPALKDAFEDVPGAPKGNRIERNIAVGGWMLLREGALESHLVVRDNVTSGDAGLVAPRSKDFRLRHDALARKVGFQPIPIERIGPRFRGHRHP